MNKFEKSLIGFSIAAVFGIIIVFSSYFTVSSTERALVTQWGEIVGEASEGLNFKIPFIQSTIFLPITENVITFDNVPVYSKDIQTATVRFSITYKYNPANLQSLYRAYGNLAVEIAITPKVNKILEEVFGKYNAIEIVNKKQVLSAEVYSAMLDNVDQSLIQIVSIQIENVDFTDTYEANIDEVLRSETKVRAAQNELRRIEIEAQQKVVQAEAEAKATIARSDAEAYSLRVKGEAEAAAIAAKGQALRDNPELVQLIAAERWNGVLPTTMLPDSSVPMLPIK